MLQRYIMEMSHLKSRRVKLTTGNTSSMQMCILLLFEQVSNTPKSPRYWPKCAVKNQGSPLFKPYFYFTNTICHEVNLFTLFTHEYQFDLVTSPDPFPGIITAFIISIFIERGPTKIKCNFYFVLYILYW